MKSLILELERISLNLKDGKANIRRTLAKRYMIVASPYGMLEFSQKMSRRGIKVEDRYMELTF